MRSTVRRSAALLSAVGLLGLALATPAAAGGRPFTTTLLGAAEVPGPGDPDGMGEATVRINPGLGEVCWTIEVSGVEPIMAAHIHVGDVTEAGPVVVPLTPYTEGCVDVDRALAKAILQDPEMYYVNVHNAVYPAGALRGQLG